MDSRWLCACCVVHIYLLFCYLHRVYYYCPRKFFFSMFPVLLASKSLFFFCVYYFLTSIFRQHAAIGMSKDWAVWCCNGGHQKNAWKKSPRERDRIVSKKWACNNHVSLLNLNLILAIWPHHPVNEKMVCMHSKRESGRSRIQQLLLESVVKKSGLSMPSGLESIVHLSSLLSRYTTYLCILWDLYSVLELCF